MVFLICQRRFSDTKNELYVLLILKLFYSVSDCHPFSLFNLNFGILVNYLKI